MVTRTPSKPKTPAAPKASSAPKSRSAPKTRPALSTAKAPKTASARKPPPVSKTAVLETAATATTRRPREKSAAEPKPARARSRARALASAALHPHEVPNVEPETDVERVPNQPFEEGVHDMIDPDLRHRLISETAYRHYAERGYEDGYDLDDWLQAEAEVDHVLLNPRPD